MSTLPVDRLLGEANPPPVIDVRSPGEFQQGHIPGAASVPLFEDEERAEIGTLYKKVGRQEAIDRGVELATAKADQLIEQVSKIANDSDFIMHCWRGGMRSAGFAELCTSRGLKPTVLDGGYKAYRQAAHQSFSQPQRVILLAGQTGAGKTRLLHYLRESGEQIIDLEGLADHRGSVFGGIGRAPQPTVEQFENELFLKWSSLDASKPVWIEGESRSIGKVFIPQAVWEQMLSSPAIYVEVDSEERIDFLLEEYGDLPGDKLAEAIERLKKRLGGLRLTAALEALQRNDRRAFTKLALEYYDKSYSNALEKRLDDSVTVFPMDKSGDPSVVNRLIALADYKVNIHYDDPTEVETALD